MKLSPFFLVSFFTIFYLMSCASVSDSVVSAIDQEQINELNDIYRQIEDFRIYNRRDSLASAQKQLDKINLDNIYNNDYKAKILGLKALSSFYHGKRFETERLLKQQREISTDEEMYWIVSSLLLEDKKERLNLLLTGRMNVFTIARMNTYLAHAYLENEQYGEATALYDTILLEESDFRDYYKSMRELSFLFMKNPPSSYKTGLIISGDQIDLKDLIDVFSIETDYFSDYKRDRLEEMLLGKKYFFEESFTPENPLVRKDLAYFLFALIADRKNDGEMWKKFDEYFNPHLSDEMKNQLEGLSPIPDIPAFRYYFYPVLFLIEEEIMELPDGEHFFPQDLVGGTELMNVIYNLERRVD